MTIGYKLKRLIENTVEAKYKEFGENAKAVRVDVELQKSIKITLNTENPYMEKKFFEFVEALRQECEDMLKIMGYSFKKTDFMYDFCILSFEFKPQSK